MPRTTLEQDGDLDDEVMRLIGIKGGSPHADLVKDMIRTTLGLIDDGNGRGELKILSTALRELRRSFQVFGPYSRVRKVSVFGSARTPADRPEYRQAHEFARRMTEREFMVITGAGGGIMQAANEGAGRDKSFGCHIRLPFESANPVLGDDDKLVTYKYFFTRKLTFVKETDGLALFPGGFGTLDECYEVLTLMQTGKSDLLPVVFLDVPGGGYWRSFERHVHEQLIPRGLISPEDVSLFTVTEDVGEAVEALVGFYRNYHSTRYVRDWTVMRLAEAPGEGLLDALNAEFADLLADGRIEASGPLPEEANEPDLAALPRLKLRFNRRSYGRFRQLIDRLNRAAPSGRPTRSPAARAQILAEHAEES